MFKFFWVILLFSSIALGGEPNKALHEKCLYPSVMIINDTNPGFGTGFIVKSIKKDKNYENYVFTCAHVIKINQISKDEEIKPVADALNPEKPLDIKARVGTYKNWSTLVSAKDYQCEILTTNIVKDIALLKFKSTKEMYTVDIDPIPQVYIGDEVYRIGCGMGEPFRLDYGKITSVKDSVGNLLRDVYRTSIPSLMGDSGGLVAHNDKVIGLLQAIHYTNINSSIPGIHSNTPVYHVSYVIPIQRFYKDPEIMKHLLKN